MTNERRYYNTFSLHEMLLSLNKEEIKKRNFHDDRLLLHWNDILGDTLACKINPCKIVFGKLNNKGIINKTLFCITKDRQLMIDFPYSKKSILDRLNIYFGIDKSIFSDIKLKLVD